MKIILWQTFTCVVLYDKQVTTNTTVHKPQDVSQARDKHSTQEDNKRYLDDNLSPQLRGRGHLVAVDLQDIREQKVAEDVLEDVGHVSLLDDVAVVLDGQNHWVPEHTSHDVLRFKMQQHAVRQLRVCVSVSWRCCSSTHSDVTKALSRIVRTTSTKRSFVVIV
jgi:hypothetical protein